MDWFLSVDVEITGLGSSLQSRWGGFISLPESSIFKQPTSGSKLSSPLSKSSYLWEDHHHQLSSLKQKTRF
jgi:hypothetical protein